MTIHSLRSRLSTMSCPLFIHFIIVCSINMNVHLQDSDMGIRRILFFLFILCAWGENSKYLFYYLKIRMGK